jgi:cell division protein FtsW
VVLMLVAVLFSAPVNGTRRWFGVGGLGIQPSELAKIACVFFTALMLERRMHRIDDLSYSLLPISLIVGLVVALILLQPDFGTSISLVLVVAVMVFAAGLHYRYFVGLRLIALPAIYLVLVAAPYRRRVCWRSGIRGPIRSATVSRSFNRWSPSEPAGSSAAV